eukprot:13555066-Alexandrium_andersonii.AAC.1
MATQPHYPMDLGGATVRGGPAACRAAPARSACARWCEAGVVPRVQGRAGARDGRGAPGGNGGEP